MEFFAVNGKRPVRLSDETRKFAFDSLDFKYGKEAWENYAVNMDDYEGFENLSPINKYDVIIEKIAREAPVRICEGEKLSGAATLGSAINHDVPALSGGKKVFSSISHLTIDFETVINKGINFIEENAKEAYKKYKNTEKEPFSKSVLNTINSIKIWHSRYLEALKEKGYEENYKALLNVPFKPAESFYEAVMSLWFTFAFVRLCGNWPGIGRIDYLLGKFLEKDLKENKITLNEAREILSHLFIKGCEWVRGGDYGSGDAQHYQNIVLSGIDEDGNEVTNEVTYLVLDILEELNISDFPTTVRINKNSPDKLLKRVAEVIKLGGGVIAVYNEELIIESLVNYGYELKEARKFANDGCWEIQIPGKTNFSYRPFDGLRLFQDKVLDNYSGTKNFSDFESLYNSYIDMLKKDIEHFTAALRDENLTYTDVSAGDWQWKKKSPCTVVSIFEEGCIERGLSYLEGGPVYNVMSPHIGGLPDLVNSLYAIKKLVFDEKRISLTELMSVLKSNWEENEALRQYVINNYTFFGNDNDEVDEIAARLVKDFADICDSTKNKSGFMHPAGISTFGRQLEWSPYRMATASGRLAHDILAGNFSPTPGTDKEGATAVIKSYCKADLRRMVSGAALDIKLLPSSVKGEIGTEAIISLIMGFCILGGHFMQLDIADTELLKKAQEHPESYSTLSVRVSGWNARFVTLNKQWQDMIIAQRGSEF